MICEMLDEFIFSGALSQIWDMLESCDFKHFYLLLASTDTVKIILHLIDFFKF